jgi:hypothetical protein
MRKTALRVSLPVVLLGLAWSFPTAGTAANTHRCGDDGHVYGLQTHGVGCGVATVVSQRLAQRYNGPSDFGGAQSTVRINQEDANGRTYKCNWQSGDSHNEIILWACKRQGNTILWIWRDEMI